MSKKHNKINKKKKRNKKMAIKKNQKWLKYLSYLSINNYLKGSISSKSSKIGNNLTLEQKIKDVNLTNYLRGVELFLSEFSEEFTDPSDIIDHWKKIRNNDEQIAKFKQNIEDYIIWLSKKYSCSTAQNYQAHLRGFLKWNNIQLRFRNYKERSEKSKETSRLGISLEEIKEFGNRIIGFLNNRDIKLFVRILQSSGLGSNEVLSWKFSDIRLMDFSKEAVKITSERKKTGAIYTTYLLDVIKTEMECHLKINSDKNDDDYIFGDAPEVAYSNFKRQFSRAYKSCVNQYYPKWSESKKALFTFHTYRTVFITICRALRVPKHIEDRFVAHQSSQMDLAYTLTGKDLLTNFKLVQNEIFGYETYGIDSEKKITEKIFDSLKELVLNNGKRESQFRKFNSVKEANSEPNNQMRIAYFLKIYETQIKNSILNDQEFLKNLKNKLNF